MQDMETGEMETRNCTHPHPLVQVLSKNGVRCSGCDEPLSGQIYSCAAGCNFFVHNSCAQSPPQIQHPFHPNHPLFLHPRPPPVFPFDPAQVWCDGCQRTRLCFTFHCEQCAFNLDLRCASLMPNLECHLHDHPLALFSSLSFDPKCQLCGAICNAFVLRCVPCNFNVHVQCVATLPQTVAVSCHRHPLTLTDSPVEDDPDELVCDACEEDRKPGHSVYCCAECDFVAHLHCGVSEILPTMLKKDVERASFIDSAIAKLDKEIALLQTESQTITTSLESMKIKLDALEKERLQHLSLQHGVVYSYPAMFC